mgnify:CR=1 FL=1
MISKKIIITELAGVGTFMVAKEGCSGCQQSCAGKWFAPGISQQSEPMQSQTDADVSVSGSGLNVIVGVLFGCPLLLLLGFGYAFQAFGITAAPLLSLAVIVTALSLAGVVLSKHGAKLIPLLRVEVKASHCE